MRWNKLTMEFDTPQTDIIHQRKKRSSEIPQIKSKPKEAQPKIEEKPFLKSHLKPPKLSALNDINLNDYTGEIAESTAFEDR